jgi:hypothetical protein
MAFVRGRTSLEEPSVESVVQFPAPSLSTGGSSGPLACAELPSTAAARDAEGGSVLSPAGPGTVDPPAGLGIALDRRPGAELSAPRYGSEARGAGGTSLRAAVSSSAHLQFELQTTSLRSAHRASAGISRGAPAHATHITSPAREAVDKEEKK